MTRGMHTHSLRVIERTHSLHVIEHTHSLHVIEHTHSLHVNHVYTNIGEMAEYTVHNVGYRRPGVSTAGLEHIFLRNSLSDSCRGQH